VAIFLKNRPNVKHQSLTALKIVIPLVNIVMTMPSSDVPGVQTLCALNTFLI